MDYITLIHTIIDPFLDDPESTVIREVKGENDKDLTFLVVSSSANTAHLIGKKGCVAFAIREIVGIAGKLENKRVHIKFESFENSEETK